MQNSLKRAHLNMDDITMLLREKDVFSISDVEYAILEPHGKLSVLKKEGAQNVTKKDMNLFSQSSPILPTDIITDGKIIRKNLSELGKDENWLDKELAKHNLALCDIDKVFFMSLLEDGNTYICLKNSAS